MTDWLTNRTQVNTEIGWKITQREGMKSKTLHMRAELPNKTGNNKTATQTTTLIKQKYRLSRLLSILWLLHHLANRWRVCLFPGILLIRDLCVFFRAEKNLICQICLNIWKHYFEDLFSFVFPFSGFCVYIHLSVFWNLWFCSWQEWRQIQPMPLLIARNLPEISQSSLATQSSLTQMLPLAGICFEICTEVQIHELQWETYFILHTFVDSGHLVDIDSLTNILQNHVIVGQSGCDHVLPWCVRWMAGGPQRMLITSRALSPALESMTFMRPVLRLFLFGAEVVLSEARYFVLPVKSQLTQSWNTLHLHTPLSSHTSFMQT